MCWSWEIETLYIQETESWRMQALTGAKGRQHREAAKDCMTAAVQHKEQMGRIVIVADDCSS